MIEQPSALRCLTFYTFTNPEGLQIFRTERNFESHTDKGNKPEHFSFGCCYLINPHELETYGDKTNNEFGYFGAYQLNKGYNGGFGEYSDMTFMLSGWRVADLTQDPQQ